MDKLNNLLNSANVSLNQLVDEHVDIEEDMDASKKQYEYFKRNLKIMDVVRTPILMFV